MKALNRTNIRLLALLVIILTTGGCDRRELYNHTELYTGIVHFSLDRQAMPSVSPDMQVHLQGMHQYIPTDTLFQMATDGTVQLSLLEGNYTVTAWNEADNVRFDGSVFRIEAGSDGLLREPSVLYATTGTLTAEATGETYHTLKLYPQTRQFRITLNINKGEPELLTGITASLSGIAAARHISNGIADDGTTRTTGNSGTLSLAFTSEGNSLSARHNLLGIVPNLQQLLTLTLHYAEGEPQTDTFDLTPLLTDFNNFRAGIDTDTFTLNADLSLNQSTEETGITGSIDGWTAGTETDIEARNE